MLLHINDTNADGWFCGYYFVSLCNLLILLLVCDIVRLQSDSVYQELRLYVRFYEGIFDVRLLLRSSTARGVTAARMSAVEGHVKHEAPTKSRAHILRKRSPPVVHECVSGWALELKFFSDSKHCIHVGKPQKIFPPMKCRR